MEFSDLPIISPAAIERSAGVTRHRGQQVLESLKESGIVKPQVSGLQRKRETLTPKDGEIFYEALTGDE